MIDTDIIFGSQILLMYKVDYYKLFGPKESYKEWEVQVFGELCAKKILIHLRFRNNL